MNEADLNAIVSLFNPRARRVLDYSHAEAVRGGANEVGTLHLVCGLAQEGHGLIARLLAASRVSLEMLCEEFGGNPFPIDRPTYLPALKVDDALARVLRFAAEEAKTSGWREIGTRHLLLGMLRADDSPAGRLLSASGMTVEATRRQLQALERFSAGRQ